MTTLKLSAPLAIILACAGAQAQVAIYSNGSANPAVVPLFTGTQTGSGVAAPAGDTWSELQATAGVANATGGFAGHVTGTGGGFRLADDFVVSGAAGWRLDSVSLYAYQTGASATAASPFSGVNIRVWNGRPGDAGSTVVFGDTTSNRMTSSTATSMYRVFNTTVAPPTAPDTSKLVWHTTVDLAQLVLPPGHYWLDWQYTTVVAGGEAFTPPVTIAGVRTQAGWNARQLSTTLGWVDLVDFGKPSPAADVAQDLPFMLTGLVVGPPCSQDFDGDGDVGTDADIEAFFACLSGNCCATCGTADFNGDGDVGTDADIESFFRVLSGGPC